MADGNNAAMREAVGNALWCLNWMDENTDNQSIKDHLAKPIELLTSALAKPARNCDVGTAEEQIKRIRRLCKKYRDEIGKCKGCPVRGVFPKDCALIWAQMPYEERGDHA